MYFYLETLHCYLQHNEAYLCHLAWSLSQVVILICMLWYYSWVWRLKLLTMNRSRCTPLRLYVLYIVCIILTGEYSLSLEFWLNHESFHFVLYFSETVFLWCMSLHHLQYVLWSLLSSTQYSFHANYQFLRHWCLNTEQDIQSCTNAGTEFTAFQSSLFAVLTEIQRNSGQSF